MPKQRWDIETLYDPSSEAVGRVVSRYGGFVDHVDAFTWDVFVPLLLSWPQARVPTAQLSLRRGLDPAEHVALGRALRPPDRPASGGL